MKFFGNHIASLLLKGAMLLFWFVPVQAQDDGVAQFIQSRERSAYLLGHTLGYGFGFQQGQILNIHNTLFWHAEIVTLKHPKEFRRTNESFPNTRTYVYGKLNRIYLLRGGMTLHRNITNKPYWGGVQVRYGLSGGVNLAMSEPVYLYILYYNVNEGTFYRNLEQYNPDKHFADHIYGRGPLGAGVKQMKFFPGLYAKGSLFFEYSGNSEVVRALEVGGAIDAFPQKIPIMAYVDNSHLHLSLYLSLHFGTRK